MFAFEIKHVNKFHIKVQFIAAKALERMYEYCSMPA